MVGRDDHVKILDFGLAKPIAPAPTEETRVANVHQCAVPVLGTFRHMAPEQVRGLAVDHRARHLFVRRRALRDAERRAGLQGNRRRHDDGDPDEGSAGARRRPLSISPALRPDRPALLEKPPSCASSRRRPIRVRARDASTHRLQPPPLPPSPPPLRSLPRSQGKLIPWTVAGLAAAAAIAIWLWRPAPSAGALAEVHRDHRSGGRRAAPDHRPTARPSPTRCVNWQLGHLRPAGRRAHCDADRQRSAAR